MNERLQLKVANYNIEVTNIRIMAIGSSSVFHVGDTRYISCSSMFDTPPESLIIGPLVPFAAESDNV